MQKPIYATDNKLSHGNEPLSIKFLWKFFEGKKYLRRNNMFWNNNKNLGGKYEIRKLESIDLGDPKIKSEKIFETKFL